MSKTGGSQQGTILLGIAGAVTVATAPQPAVAGGKISAATVAKASDEIAKLIKADQNKGPTLVRLAWHSSGTYDKMSKTGGSQQGTIRFKEELAHGGNAGLDKAVAWMEPIKQAVPEMSYADLYTLSGAVAIKTLGGPSVPWRAGRVDSMSPSDVTPDGRLPGADNGSYAKDASHLRDIFYRMGFNDQEIVALSGAHALGRCHEDASGFVGPWTPTPTMFNNLYFTLLKNATWEEGCIDGATCKNHQYRDGTKKLMMLPTDIALTKDPSFSKWVNVYADDKDKFFKDFSGAFSTLLELGTKDLYVAA
jgi:cytochrome c peroxidase